LLRRRNTLTWWRSTGVQVALYAVGVDMPWTGNAAEAAEDAS
jgi:hypothetical protein